MSLDTLCSRFSSCLEEDEINAKTRLHINVIYQPKDGVKEEVCYRDARHLKTNSKNCFFQMSVRICHCCRERAYEQYE